MLQNNPIKTFADWYVLAERQTYKYPNAMALATVGKDGTPSVRMVLMKHFDADGLVFYTNLESAKSQDIKATGLASACFYWESLGRQVRVSGPVEAVTPEEADEYFATRAHDSQIGAWASFQSRPMANREEFELRFQEFQKKFAGMTVPRPPGWSGWRIKAQQIEFWIEREFRLHDRYLYTRKDQSWEREILYP